MLQALIREDGVNVLSATVTTMHSSPDNATITLDDGQTLSADFLVCADGYDSTFRSIVTGVEDDDDLDTPPKAHLITTFILPMDVIRQEKVLQYNTDPAQVRHSICTVDMYHVDIVQSGKYGKCGTDQDLYSISMLL